MVSLGKGEDFARTFECLPKIRSKSAQIFARLPNVQEIVESKSVELLNDHLVENLSLISTHVRKFKHMRHVHLAVYFM